VQGSSSLQEKNGMIKIKKRIFFMWYLWLDCF
jgi:hypothetical protein